MRSGSLDLTSGRKWPITDTVEIHIAIFKTCFWRVYECYCTVNATALKISTKYWKILEYMLCCSSTGYIRSLFEHNTSWHLNQLKFRSTAMLVIKALFNNLKFKARSLKLLAHKDLLPVTINEKISCNYLLHHFSQKNVQVFSFLTPLLKCIQNTRKNKGKFGPFNLFPPTDFITYDTANQLFCF